MRRDLEDPLPFDGTLWVHASFGPPSCFASDTLNAHIFPCVIHILVAQAEQVQSRDWFLCFPSFIELLPPQPTTPNTPSPVLVDFSLPKTLGLWKLVC